jgi:membrane fusion protein (multidrug efflux system)
MSKTTVLKTTGGLICAVIGALVGWYLNDIVASGPMGAQQAAMGAQGGMKAGVTAITVKESFLNPAAEYIAQVEPVEDVMIRSEVSGYVDSVNFTEGSLVNEGDVLFQIDPRTYQAEANQAEAALINARKRYDRMKNADPRSVSKTDLETAEADLLSAQAAYDRAKVSLEYTEIKAPVRGRIGAAEVKKGNYVTSSSGALARIVQVDPIRVTFSMTDREYLALRQRELAGDDSARVAQVKLPSGPLLPTLGKKDFDDNAINPETGTIAVRYLFENKDQLLIPGGYVTALLRNAKEEKGILIAQKAVLVDRQGAYVLTVSENGVVGTARIEPGTQIGTELSVLSGLKEGDRIIVDGVQKAQPGATVNVTLAEDK